MEYYTAISKNEIAKFSKSIDGFRVCAIKWGRPTSERKTMKARLHMQILAYSCTYTCICKQMWLLDTGLILGDEEGQEAGKGHMEWKESEQLFKVLTVL